MDWVFGLKSLSDDRERKEQANLCLQEQEMGAEQLTNKMCKSSRIPDSLSCCFNIPRNVEMYVPELGSLLSVLKAALSWGQERSKAAPLLQGSSTGSQNASSCGAVRGGRRGWALHPAAGAPGAGSCEQAAAGGWQEHGPRSRPELPPASSPAVLLWCR